jgi:hypothetical protein
MPELPVIQSAKKYGVSINLHDFGQAVFEEYQLSTLKASQTAFFQFGSDGTGVTAQAHVRGVTVRTAVRLKIVTGITLDELESMKPYVVDWMADEIKKHVKNVVTPPVDPAPN